MIKWWAKFIPFAVSEWVRGKLKGSLLRRLRKAAEWQLLKTNHTTVHSIRDHLTAASLAPLQWDSSLLTSHHHHHKQQQFVKFCLLCACRETSASLKASLWRTSCVTIHSVPASLGQMWISSLETTEVRRRFVSLLNDNGLILHRIEATEHDGQRMDYW